MRALLDQDVDRLLVGLGGSATNDGGTGMARALGIRFLDAEGGAIPEGGAALLNLARIDARGIDPRLATVDCVGLTDVDNPLCGPTGASATYGPQKGASPEDVWDLDRALGHLAAVVYRDLGLDVQHEPGAGAAGGLGFGLLAFCGASLRPGVDAVMDMARTTVNVLGNCLATVVVGKWEGVIAKDAPVWSDTPIPGSAAPLPAFRERARGTAPPRGGPRTLPAGTAAAGL